MIKDLSRRLLGTHPAELFEALDRMFPEEDWLAWEPETLQAALSGVDDPIALDKALAVQACASNSDLVLRNAVAFENVVTAFNNNPVVVDAPQSPYLEEVLYAVRQLRQLIQKVHDQEAEFTGEIPGYVAAVAKTRNWSVLPDELDFAQQMLDYLTGLAPQSRKHAEQAKYLESAAGIAKKLAKVDFSPEEIRGIDLPEEPQGRILGRYIGLFVFDPTIPYRT